jgi:hypothetical protein
METVICWIHCILDNCLLLLVLLSFKNLIQNTKFYASSKNAKVFFMSRALCTNLNGLLELKLLEIGIFSANPEQMKW